jgi:dTDP-4-amino-4,6-dideoxygalactose transaminase
MCEKNAMLPEPILQTDPKSVYLAHREEILAAVTRALDSGWYILGKEVSAFEEEFAHSVGLSHCIGVNSGTDALSLALRAVGVGQGDVVFTVSHTAVATAAAIKQTGGIPFFLDIAPQTFTLAPESLEDALKKNHDIMGNPFPGKPKAVVAVHLYGHPADMDSIVKISRAYGLTVVEDCAQAHGVALAGRQAGTWGDIAAFSFYPTKNLGALGDAGAVATNSAALAEEVRLLREYGWRERYISEKVGFNSRLDEIQAAILRVQLQYLEQNNIRRREIAAMYDEALEGIVNVPVQLADARHVYHQYVIRTKQRDALRGFLKERGIATLVHYPSPIHLQPAYAQCPTAPSGLPFTEEACKEIVSLPMCPCLSSGQVGRVINAIREWKCR